MDIINNFIEWSITNWYVYIIIIILFIYSKYKDKEKIGNLSLEKMFVIVEIGIYFILIYLIQVKLFSEHYYFIISLPIWILLWGTAINYLLSKDNVHLIETTLKGEKFNDMIEGKEIMSLTTRIRLIIMDRSYYNVKPHIGDTNNPLINVSRSIKFCDLYDDNSGVIYHSEIPELQNINLYTHTAFMLKLKEDMPKVINENITHTFMEDWKLVYKLQALVKNLKISLKGIKEQTKEYPFELFKSMEDYLEYVSNLKTFESENEIPTENKEGVKDE